MNCPHCGFEYRKFIANAPEIPEITPIMCEACGEICLLSKGHLHTMTAEELVWLKQSPAWKDFLEPAQQVAFQNKKARKLN